MSYLMLFDFHDMQLFGCVFILACNFQDLIHFDFRIWWLFIFNFKMWWEFILISGSDRQTDQRNCLVIKQWNRNPVMWKLCHWPSERLCGLVSSTSTSTLLSVLVVLILCYYCWPHECFSGAKKTCDQEILWRPAMKQNVAARLVMHALELCIMQYACIRTVDYALCMH